jgi:hypothetical protein
MTAKYQLTFVWPDDSWTWHDTDANDFHQAMLIALDKCPSGCRVKSIQLLREGVDFALSTRELVGGKK